MAGSMILPVYGKDRNYGVKTWYDDYFDWDDSDFVLVSKEADMCQRNKKVSQ